MIDISVVIPTFRRPALLLEALASALAQEGVSVEAVVVDDSPEGSARAVVEGLGDARVAYMKCEPPSGGKPALVRNAGWPRARGRFVHFLDDDDRVAAGYYRAAVVAFEANPRRGVVFGRVEPFGDDPEAIVHERAFFESASRRARLMTRTGSRRVLTANLLFSNTVLVNSACMLRRECIAELGGYNASIPRNEDVDFYARAIRKFGWTFLDRVVLHYRILAGSLMHGNTDEAAIKESYRRIYAQYRDTYGAPEFLAMKVFSRAVLRFL